MKDGISQLYSQYPLPSLLLLTSCAGVPVHVTVRSPGLSLLLLVLL